MYTSADDGEVSFERRKSVSLAAMQKCKGASSIAHEGPLCFAVFLMFQLRFQEPAFSPSDPSYPPSMIQRLL